MDWILEIKSILQRKLVTYVLVKTGPNVHGEKKNNEVHQRQLMLNKFIP